MGTRWTCGSGFDYVLDFEEQDGQEGKGKEGRRNDGIDAARRGHEIIFWG